MPNTFPFDFEQYNAFQLGFDAKNIEEYVFRGVMNNVDYSDDNKSNEIVNNVNRLLNSGYIKYNNTHVHENTIYVKYDVEPNPMIKRNFVQIRTSKKIPFNAITNDSNDFVMFSVKIDNIGVGDATEVKKKTDEFMEDVFNEFMEEINKIRDDIVKKCKSHFEIQNEVYHLNQ